MLSEEKTRKSKQSVDTLIKLNERVSRVLETAPFRDLGKWGRFGDVKLAISGTVAAVEVEICDCDDVEGYVETVVLMYCDDLKRRLVSEVREEVSKVLGLLKEDASSNHGNHINRLDVSKDTLYHICHGWLSSIVLCLSEAKCVDESRQDRGGQILMPKDIRYSLLSTWLEVLYDDFGWTSRAGRSMDKRLVEDGLGQTILTLRRLASLLKQSNEEALLRLLRLPPPGLLITAVIDITTGVNKFNKNTIKSTTAHAIVKSSCSITMYPDLCYSPVASVPGMSKKISGPKDVILASLNLTTTAVEHNYVSVKKLMKRKSLTEREKTALQDCLETIDENPRDSR
ncbi:pectin methylesterase 3 [Actinidia rufa]|uniref:Pectin methylesterase 3 n=1 Tax=Actinidia rufa TaxID=165716 RepID=A0A7J0DHC8_9ERIC|nr:pectin methylesterase 3 [Actinidia rufa]GFZ10289.1 pectin methylesterase 3 [Actinidia rufa]